MAKVPDFKTLPTLDTATTKGDSPAAFNATSNAPSFSDDTLKLESFLKDGEAKQKAFHALEELTKAAESENVDRRIAQFKNEQEHSREGSNIAPLLSESANMAHVESMVAGALQHTQQLLVRTVEDRAAEIERLLKKLGGFSAQLRACFARSAVVFLQRPDPQKLGRELISLTIHLPDYELVKISGESEEARASSPHPVWDSAVTALLTILEDSGLHAMYVKNDRRSGHLVVMQDLCGEADRPDEYFALILDCNAGSYQEAQQSLYDNAVSHFEEKVTTAERAQAHQPFLGRKNKEREVSQAKRARDHFMATAVDPSQVPGGFLLKMEAVTLTDYHVVAEAFENIITQLLLALSQIAQRDARGHEDFVLALKKHDRLFQNTPLGRGHPHKPKLNLISREEKSKSSVGTPVGAGKKSVPWRPKKKL